jgi:L-seryl-tRNA(Ser) seleniumtransferase
VHPSNYRIVGFASSPERTELSTLAGSAGLPLYEDAGSGLLNDLQNYGVHDEPVVREIIESGVQVVSFSGDKLLGSVQAGLIAGKHEIVSRLRKHPLYRALRSDKIRLAALEATLLSYQRGEAQTEVPLMKMLSLSAAELEEQTHEVMAAVGSSAAHLELIKGESTIGGGAGPTSTLSTTLIAITHPERSAQDIEHQLRSFSPAIIARISEEKVLLDLRSVFSDEIPLVIQALKNLR